MKSTVGWDHCPVRYSFGTMVPNYYQNASMDRKYFNESRDGTLLFSGSLLYFPK